MKDDVFPAQVKYSLPMKYLSYKEYFDGKCFDEDGKRKRQILAEGTYKGYQWLIVSYYTHPCAYIITKMNDGYYKQQYWTLNLDVHGGLTYSDYGLHTIVEKDKWVIGWDYGHYGDYKPYNETGKKWTTIEISFDIIRAIDIMTEEQEWGE